MGVCLDVLMRRCYEAYRATPRLAVATVAMSLRGKSGRLVSKETLPEGYTAAGCFAPSSGNAMEASRLGRFEPVLQATGKLSSSRDGWR
jgi:hypothetical protein